MRLMQAHQNRANRLEKVVEISRKGHDNRKYKVAIVRTEDVCNYERYTPLNMRRSEILHLSANTIGVGPKESNQVKNTGKYCAYHRDYRHHTNDYIFLCKIELRN